MEHENARDRVDAVIRCRDGFSIGDDKVEARPTPKVPARVPDVGLRQIEAERRKPWPGLLDQIEEPVPQPRSISRKAR